MHVAGALGDLGAEATFAARPVVIERNTSLGARCIVLKGVRIGRNAIVGAGAVVAHDVPDDCVVFGNPARVIWRSSRRSRKHEIGRFV